MTSSPAPGPDVALRCRCGQLEGYLASPGTTERAVCYCRDCRAFARFLERAPELLDANGGADIIATQPRHVHFTRGADRLACVSLSDQGLYRWYASCCRTPIANTPRDPRVSYAGVLAACLAATPAQLDAAFGPPEARLHTASATGPVAATRLRTLRAGLAIMRRVLAARFSGQWRENPFFRPDGTSPVAAARVLAPKVRAMLS